MTDECIFCKVKYYPPAIKTGLATPQKHGVKYCCCGFHYEMMKKDWDGRREEMEAIVERHIAKEYAEQRNLKEQWAEITELFKKPKTVKRQSWIWRSTK